MTVLRSANPFDQLPKGVKTLVVINAAVFLIQSFSPHAFISLFGLTPIMVFKHFYVWQLVTYAFLHGSLWHLLMNLFSLWMFGPHIEFYWGTKSFVRYYFLCVVGAALAQSALSPNSLVVGASGGIYGLLLAFGLLFPDTVILIFFVFPLKAIQAVFVIGLMTFLFSMDQSPARVAHFAHLGGMLTGLLYFKWPLFWEALKRRKTVRSEGLHVIQPNNPVSPSEPNLDAEVDHILEKISAQGVESLTPHEHEIMRRYGERHK